MANDLESRFVGCLLGLALGDALGAPYEGGWPERIVWKLIGRTADGRMRWTDDTQMSLDIAESLIDLQRLHQGDLAARFAQSYRWSRGYGPGAGRLLKRIRRGADWRVANRAIHRDGSFGNGAAMRAPVVALWCAATGSELEPLVAMSAEITHAHPIGKEGALLVALATRLALGDAAAPEILNHLQARASHETFRRRLGVAAEWLGAPMPPPKELARSLGNGISAADSCVTAIFLALRFFDARLSEILAAAAACGGDVDTISAMAGAIWGARNGAVALPPEAVLRVEQSERIRDVAVRMHAAAIAARSRADLMRHNPRS